MMTRRGLFAMVAGAFGAKKLPVPPFPAIRYRSAMSRAFSCSAAFMEGSEIVKISERDYRIPFSRHPYDDLLRDTQIILQRSALSAARAVTERKDSV